MPYEGSSKQTSPQSVSAFFRGIATRDLISNAVNGGIGNLLNCSPWPGYTWAGTEALVQFTEEPEALTYMIGRLWSGSRFFGPAKAELHPQRTQLIRPAPAKASKPVPITPRLKSNDAKTPAILHERCSRLVISEARPTRTSIRMTMAIADPIASGIFILPSKPTKGKQQQASSMARPTEPATQLTCRRETAGKWRGRIPGPPPLPSESTCWWWLS